MTQPRRMLRISQRIPVSPAWGVIGGAVIRAALTAVIGAVLTASMGVLLWAMTPQDGLRPVSFARAGVTAFAAGHFQQITLTAGGYTGQLTIAPLLITALMVCALASIAGRASASSTGRAAEAVAAGLTGVVYGGCCYLISITFAAPGTVSAGRWWAPMALGSLAALVGLALRGHAWREFGAEHLPNWLPTSLRAGSVAVVTLLAGGLLTLTIALIASFGAVMSLFDLSTPNAMDGAGMLLVCLLLIPNAAIAAMSFTLGAGFQIGSGTYTPFRTMAVDLPGIPLLAGTPASGGIGPSLALVAIPILGAALAGYVIARDIPGRNDRLRSAGCAGLLTGVIIAVLCLVAGGGVRPSTWAELGMPALLIGGIAGLMVAVIAGALAVSVPERGQPTDDRSADDTAVIDRVLP